MPTSRRVLWSVAVAVPPLMMGVAGLWHPMDITPATAHQWRFLHILLLPVFPLLAIVIIALLRDERGVVSWIARIAAYGYAVYYTGLDTLAGIGAGTAMSTDPADPATTPLLAIGNNLAPIGQWCYVVAVVITAALLTYRARWPAVPGAVLLLLATIPFTLDHIYWPWGVLSMLATAVAVVGLEATRPTSTRPGPAVVRGQDVGRASDTVV